MPEEADDRIQQGGERENQRGNVDAVFGPGAGGGKDDSQGTERFNNA